MFEFGALSAVEADAMPLTDIGHWIGMLQDWHEAKSRRERRARG